MPHIRDIFPSTIMRGADLDGQPMQVTFDGWSNESRWGGFFALSLRDQPYKLKLTPALGRDLAKINGGNDDIESFIELTVEIYPEDITIRDHNTGDEKQVTVIRARAVPGAKPRLLKPRPPLDDEIPF